MYQSEVESCYSLRRKRLLRQIKGEAALFVAAPHVTSGRDLHYPFEQATDLLYLTGINEPQIALVLLGTSKGSRSVLYLRDRDPEHEKWNGERIGLKRAKRRYRVDEVRDISTFAKDLPQLLSGLQTLHFSPGINSEFDQTVFSLFQSSVGPRLNTPHTLRDARLITSEMRFTKDRTEITALRRAAEITATGFQMLLPRLKEATSEFHAAQMLEAFFARAGGHGLAFPTIMASGKNATILHHEPTLQPLWKRELLLIDAGAKFRGYCGDITRTVPVSGKFSEPQGEIYDLVNSALNAAITKAQPGNTLDDMHEVAVRTLVRGLLDLGILKGNAGQIIASGEYKRFYMHRTGHWLGIDVHDISPVTIGSRFVPSILRPLAAGNAFTIEPGLYFDPKDDHVPLQYRGIGVRIEQDVLITPSGHEILSDGIPTDREEIEKLCGA